MDRMPLALLCLALSLGASTAALAQSTPSPNEPANGDPVTSDPGAPLSPTLTTKTTSQVPSPTAAAHTASEVLAYLLAYDEMAIALGRQGRDRQLDVQVRFLAGNMISSHTRNIGIVRALADETKTPIVQTTDVKARTDLGGTELDGLGKASDADYPARFLDAVSELSQDGIDLIDKRLMSDVADDPRLVAHLRATREWLVGEKVASDRLRAAGK